MNPVLSRIPVSKTLAPAQFRPKLRSDRFYALLAETFRTLADTTRLRIIWMLSHGELPVGSLSKSLKISQPAVSHHLRTLRILKLVKVRRKGQSLFYALDDEHINQLLREGTVHVEELMR